jgi:hypothetical protein
VPNEEGKGERRRREERGREEEKEIERKKERKNTRKKIFEIMSKKEQVHQIYKCSYNSVR